MRFWVINMFGIPVEVTGAADVIDRITPQVYAAHGHLMTTIPTCGTVMHSAPELPADAIRVDRCNTFAWDVDTWGDIDGLGRG